MQTVTGHGTTKASNARRVRTVHKLLSGYATYIVVESTKNAYPLLGDRFSGGGPHGSRNSWLISQMLWASEKDCFEDFFDMDKVSSSSLGRFIILRRKQELMTSYPVVIERSRAPGMHWTALHKYLFFKWGMEVVKKNKDVYFINNTELVDIGAWAFKNKFWRDAEPDRVRELWSITTMSKTECENVIFYLVNSGEDQRLRELYTSGSAEDMFRYYCEVALLHQWMCNHDDGAKVGANTILHAFEYVVRLVVLDEYAGLIEDFDRDEDEVPEEVKNNDDVEVSNHFQERKWDDEAILSLPMWRTTTFSPLPSNNENFAPPMEYEDEPPRKKMLTRVSSLGLNLDDL